MNEIARWFPGLDDPDDSRPTLFCFPAAGGNTSVFYSWRTRLSDRFQVVPVELPGHRGRLHEPPYESIHSLVDDLASAMEKLLDRPYTLLGTSLGALVAFETARRLQGLGHVCERLVVAACSSPRTRRADPVHTLPDDQFLQRLCELGATPDEVLASAELRRLLLPAWRADFALLENYSYFPGDKLRSPIVVVNAEGDPHVRRSDALAWEWETFGHFEFTEVAGGHFFFLEHSSTILPSMTFTHP